MNRLTIELNKNHLFTRKSLNKIVNSDIKEIVKNFEITSIRFARQTVSWSDEPRNVLIIRYKNKNIKK